LLFGAESSFFSQSSTRSLLKDSLGRYFEARGDMESLFLMAFGQEEFLAALAGAGSKAGFNKLLVALPGAP
jgi:hypothetical protein